MISISKIDKAKFRRQVLPGEVLTLEMEIIRLKAQVAVGRGHAHVDGETAVTAELTFAFQK